MTVKLSKTDKLFNLLSRGTNVPIRALEKKTGLVNISAAVDRLRQEGHQIYLNKRRVKDEVVNFYRMSV